MCEALLQPSCTSVHACQSAGCNGAQRAVNGFCQPAANTSQLSSSTERPLPGLGAAGACLQLYSEALGKFLADRFVVGTCPKCGYEVRGALPCACPGPWGEKGRVCPAQPLPLLPAVLSPHEWLLPRDYAGSPGWLWLQDARGDQCDACGNLMNPVELINPRCKVTGTTPVVRSTRHIFLDLPQLTEKLQDYITTTSRQGGWSANCVQLTNAWMRDGLKQRCISRDLQWGIPVPLEGFGDKVRGVRPSGGGGGACAQASPGMPRVHDEA